MDKVSKAIRSKTMSSIHSKDTAIELEIRKRLHKYGLRYRKNVGNLPGKPDIAFLRKRVVVFCDSCFWHGCNKHFRQPKSNQSYWNPKIKRNIERGREIFKKYQKEGWIVLRFWEHDIHSHPDKVTEKIRETINRV